VLWPPSICYTLSVLLIVHRNRTVFG
jgi:hypothetical protein